ncbi:KTSC domain-containing protein [Rhizobium mesosinicum]|uniref:KTSC domain-containing protein n=1 Tax=Rhizobium mesosinicum TaxID=335017 RepID=A0ABS7H048_9HYPH|nr:KTSC domain-containing protein [Rhizobium mesosinicum]MBW9054913.1 KTSC domain-containing protein [Rhizobium mesosinicum]
MFRWLRSSKNKTEADSGAKAFRRLTYDTETSTLFLEFHSGETRTHVGVALGHIVGLKVAADKLAYYQSQIAPSYMALIKTGDEAAAPAAAPRYAAAAANAV